MGRYLFIALLVLAVVFYTRRDLKTRLRVVFVTFVLLLLSMLELVVRLLTSALKLVYQGASAHPAVAVVVVILLAVWIVRRRRALPPRRREPFVEMPEDGLHGHLRRKSGEIIDAEVRPKPGD